MCRQAVLKPHFYIITCANKKSDRKKQNRAGNKTCIGENLFRLAKIVRMRGPRHPPPGQARGSSVEVFGNKNSIGFRGGLWYDRQFSAAFRPRKTAYHTVLPFSRLEHEHRGPVMKSLDELCCPRKSLSVNDEVCCPIGSLWLAKTRQNLGRNRAAMVRLGSSGRKSKPPGQPGPSRRVPGTKTGRNRVHANHVDQARPGAILMS